MSHLLLVEDDDDLRQDLAALLELEGYRVHVAANGAEALDDLRRSPMPCLILLDLMMPVMDGWQFRQEQLKDPSLAGVPVVITSGVADQAAALQALRVMKKPVKLKALLEVISERCAPAAAAAS